MKRWGENSRRAGLILLLCFSAHQHHHLGHLVVARCSPGVDQKPFKRKDVWKYLKMEYTFSPINIGGWGIQHSWRPWERGPWLAIGALRLDEVVVEGLYGLQGKQCWNFGRDLTQGLLRDWRFSRIGFHGIFAQGYNGNLSCKWDYNGYSVPICCNMLSILLNYSAR